MIPGCVQRINLTSKQLVWNTTDEKAFSYIYQSFDPLITESDLYFCNTGDLIKINKSSGEERILTSTPNYSLMPLAQSGDILIARAKRTKGTTKYELWGVNVETGAILWQKEMKDAEPIDPPDEMVGLIDDSDWGWTGHLSEEGLVLLTFSGEPNQVMIETIDVVDGTSLQVDTLPLKNVGGDFYGIPSVIYWQGSVGYFDLEYDLYSIDLSTMEGKRIY